MTCATCKYYRRGECRKHAPAVIPVAPNLQVDRYVGGGHLAHAQGPATSVWPEVYSGDWCGEYEEVAK